MNIVSKYELVEKIRKETLEQLEIEEFNSGVFWGEWAPIDGKDTFDCFSPIDGSKIASATKATKQDYEKVVKASQDAFNEWKNVPAPQRGQLVRAIGDELRKYKIPLGRLVSLEVGKILTEGEGEVQEVIDIANFAVGLSRQFYGFTIASERENHRMYEQWLPLGPFGVITAFNFPTAVWGWNTMIGAAAGDTSIWKPSRKGALVAIATIKIVNKVLNRMGYPTLFFLVNGNGGEVGEWLSNDYRLPLISFTGSIPTGKRIAENVAKRLGRTVLELGGNNAAIVTPDADINIALKGVGFGSLATTGQRCTTTRRLIIHEDRYDEFIDRLKMAFDKIQVGNPLAEGTLMGPLINEGAYKGYINALEFVQKEGGKILYGGNRINVEGLDGGYYVEPAIVDSKSEWQMVCRETFAPILYVIKYKTIEEALKYHNYVPQGLSSAIFTNNLREEEYFLSPNGSDCGIANVNTSTAGAEIGGAFGGEKETGGGRESGSDAWKNYMRRQTVTINHGKSLPLSQGVKFDV